MIEVTVDTIQVSLISQSRMVVLKEKGVERYLPIWIGPFEAEAIAIRLQGVETARPLTHDLLVNVIGALHARLLHIAVTALVEDTFYARLALDVNGLMTEIDSRPSDAIALAVREGVPIYVDEMVMEVAGVVPERGLDQDEEELGVFRQFLDSLNLEDLERND